MKTCKTAKKPEILGVDIGNVLRIPVGDGRVGSLDRPDNSYLESPDFHGALDAIRQLAEAFRFEEIHIVSKIEEVHEEKLLRWLTHKGYGRFIHPGRVHFCRERSDKARICKEMGITHFIDDRLEVLSHMEEIPNICWFRGSPALREDDKKFLPLVEQRNVEVFFSWQEVLEKFLPRRHN